MGGYALLEVTEVYGAPHAHEGRLAAEGFEVCARVAAGGARYLLQVEGGVRGHAFGVDPQDVQAGLGVGQPDLYLVVEAARTPEGRVEG